MTQGAYPVSLSRTHPSRVDFSYEQTYTDGQLLSKENAVSSNVLVYKVDVTDRCNIFLGHTPAKFFMCLFLGIRNQ